MHGVLSCAANAAYCDTAPVIGAGDKGDLAEKIGSISSESMAQVLEGIELLIKPRDIKELD